MSNSSSNNHNTLIISSVERVNCIDLDISIMRVHVDNSLAKPRTTDKIEDGFRMTVGIGVEF